MPDLGNISITLTRCSSLKPLSPPPPLNLDAQSDSTTIHSLCSDSVKTLVKDCNWDQNLLLPIPIPTPIPIEERCNDRSIRVLRKKRKKGGGGANGKCLDDYVRVWAQKKMDSGVSNSRCFLPFLVSSKKIAECLVCHRLIYPGEEVLCSVRNCGGVFHFICVKETFHVSNPKKFKCPQHACFVCKQKFDWRCVRCLMASHDRCGPWPDKVIHLIDPPRRAVCWRHPTNWLLDKKEVFSRLPLPYVEEEFKIDATWKGLMENKLEPPPYVHIRRNVYLVKKKRDDVDNDVGCTSCSSSCCEDCVCRVQCISCSRACHCSENCTNRPFRKEKKIKIVKTEFCGWGVETVEPINKGDFIIEYIGEVIDDAVCEQRLWDMKYKGVQNFYMCEIRKDFTIDATFKGNSSRFLNHSCDPNCILEKWQVEGETRVGVFAARSIKVGEPLTYDYRFVQFGPEVRCHCGAPNCHGYLGTKRKICKLNICWGAKRRRSSTACLAIVTYDP
ncbi:set domain protein, putative [Ricinus communis]|uniref:Set domain protein, putative n=1 Tax=Ricinus communis TaxID=3988 RepID=B9SQW4_RICCO|nr:set domain protein, putative [Ricinus communis]|eukprot:XP_002528383.1 histone-lysine N-methyltransferase ASHR3 isoform X1 [Ricinus communis]